MSRAERWVDRLLPPLAAVAVIAVIATDPWLTESLAGIATALGGISAVGAICWLAGYYEGKKGGKNGR